MEDKFNEDGVMSSLGVGKYINPLSDWGFKKLFGSEPNKELLLELLNVILDETDKKIVAIEYSNNEHQGLSDSDRSSKFDVSCKTEDGDRFVVEMQNGNQAHFAKRLIYYSGFPIQEQAKKGMWDFNYAPVIMVGLLNFKIEHLLDEPERCIYYYDIRERYISEIMSDRLRFIIVEIDKFNKKININSPIKEKWLYLLKHLHRLFDKPKALQEKVFESFFQAAEVSKLSREDQQKYINAMRTESDIHNQKEFRYQEGLKQGREEGREEGMEEGIARTRLELAREFLINGVDIMLISKSTGLPIEEIENLR